METKFVKAFVVPKLVVYERSKSVLGVFDGCRTFDKGYYALLENETVTLYDASGCPVFVELADVWVAPNEYFLVKNKFSTSWELYDFQKRLFDKGDVAKVYSKGNMNLVFLWQNDTLQWNCFAVCKNQKLPSSMSIVAQDVDVIYEENFAKTTLVFVLKFGKKRVLQCIDAQHLEPIREVTAVNHYAYFENQGFVCSTELLKVVKGSCWVEISSRAEAKLEVYTSDLVFISQADHLVLLPFGLKLMGVDGNWRILLGEDVLQENISEVELHQDAQDNEPMITGKTASGEDVKISILASQQVVLKHADEQMHIFSKNFVVKTKKVQDVCLI